MLTDRAEELLRLIGSMKGATYTTAPHWHGDAEQSALNAKEYIKRIGGEVAGGYIRRGDGLFLRHHLVRLRSMLVCPSLRRDQIRDSPLFFEVVDLRPNDPKMLIGFSR